VISAIEVTALPTFSLAGAISPSSIGTGTVLALSGAKTASVVVSTAGTYTFGQLGNGTYTVTPSKPGYLFVPPSQSVTLSGASVAGLDFTVAEAPTYTVTGTISPLAGGAGHGEPGGPRARPRPMTPASIFAGVFAGNCAVPSNPLPLPAVEARISVTDSGLTGIDFTSQLPTYAISGTIRPVAGGARATVSGGAAIVTTTDRSGAIPSPAW
jgi:hypothetical protein